MESLVAIVVIIIWVLIALGNIMKQKAEYEKRRSRELQKQGQTTTQPRPERPAEQPAKPAQEEFPQQEQWTSTSSGRGAWDKKEAEREVKPAPVPKRPTPSMPTTSTRRPLRPPQRQLRQPVTLRPKGMQGEIQKMAQTIEDEVQRKKQEARKIRKRIKEPAGMVEKKPRRGKKKGLEFSENTLINGVIFSEIFGKPVSKRKKFPRRFV
jgi:septin family protein